MNIQCRCKVERIDIFTRLNQDFHSDLFWWYTFIGDWNGLSILGNPNTHAPADFCVKTDVSGIESVNLFTYKYELFKIIIINSQLVSYILQKLHH